MKVYLKAETVAKVEKGSTTAINSKNIGQKARNTYVEAVELWRDVVKVARRINANGQKWLLVVGAGSIAGGLSGFIGAEIFQGFKFYSGFVIARLVLISIGYALVLNFLAFSIMCVNAFYLK